MNDFKPGTKFSYGKVELGVVDDFTCTVEEQDNRKKPHNRVNTVLCHKMEAVDALDSLRFRANPIDIVAYETIRNALEELAALIKKDNSYEDNRKSPLPKRKNHRSKRRGGNKMS